MLQGALWVALEAVLLLALLVASGIAVFMFYDPAVRRALVFGKAYPQPSRLPVVGHLMQILRPRNELFGLLRSFREQFGSRYVIILFGRTFFNLCDPQSVEAVLSSSKNLKKGRVYEFLKPWLGQGLLTSDGKLWHWRRKMLTPAFHFRILDQFSEHLEQQAICLADDLDAARTAPTAPGVPPGSIDVVPIVSKITLRSICVTAMGKVDFQTSQDAAEDAEKSYFDAIHRVGVATVMRMVRPWLWIPLVFRATSIYWKFRQDLHILHGYTEKVIMERKKQLFSDAGTPDDRADVAADTVRKRPPLRPFLDVLLNAQRDGAELSDKDIREEVDTFMFEGHDTTSMALSWALELVGRLPDVQTKLAEELDEVACDWEAVSKLPYLDRVLKECLRLRPSVPFISRDLNTDVVMSDGTVLPAGSAVNVHIYDLHRNPDYFPDPERFDPDRFLPELEQARHPFAYVPFSAGPRNCIGKRFAVMELKLLLASVIRRFHIRSAMGEKLDAIADLVLRPSAGVYLELTPR